MTGPAGHDHPAPAMLVRTGDPVDTAGAWVPVEHLEGEGCAAEPRRHSLPTALPAPPCPHCGDPVRWQLTDLPTGETEAVR